MNDRDRPWAANPPSQPPPLDAGPACYQEGEYWTFVYGGVLCRLRNAKGLPCLAHLLRHPGEKFSATDLLAIGTETSTLARTGTEPPAVDVESARVLVTKRIRGMVKKIQPHHPSLAHHLDTCIKTGAYCVYLPNPEHPLRWAT